MENKAMNRTNVIYESPYTGQEETEILQHAESLKDQTRASDGNMADTVQVYDTDGVPHTISKTELISKAGVNLPSLDQIGGFVAYDKEGNALGLMSTEQVAEVVGELNGIDVTMYKYRNLFHEDILLLQKSGLYVLSNKATNTPWQTFALLDLKISFDRAYKIYTWIDSSSFLCKRRVIFETRDSGWID